MTTFGYSVEAPIDWSELLDLALELENDSGFNSLWIADSLVANGPPDEPKLEAWTVLAAIAQATTRLRIGLRVAGNVYRHPVTTAKIATTIDHISGGRLEFGFGSGWPDRRAEAYGLDFGSRRERLERFAEALEVIKLLWTSESPRFEGKHYRLDGPPFSPRPVQRPHPPIVIGAGKDATLRIAAKYADRIDAMIPINEAQKKVDAFCREIARDPQEISWSGGGWLFLNDDPQVLRRALDAAIEQYGEPEETIRKMGLIGSTDEVIGAVRRLVDHGAQEIVMFQLPKVHRASLSRFSEVVIPNVT